MFLDRASSRRIWWMTVRYLYLHRRSVVRVFDIFFWPVMDLLVWGFVALYIQQIAGRAVFQVVLFLIGAMISWDIHYRGQQAITLALMEEIWTRNITNILLSPIRLKEWIAAVFLYGSIKVAIVTLVLVITAQALYSFDILRIGWVFIPLAINLLFFGWAMGLFTAGLLLRYGYAAEAMIWGIPFLIQPFSCVFYPMDVLPVWAQTIAVCLPTTYIFEGLRLVLSGKEFLWHMWGPVLGLNLLYGAVGVLFFMFMIKTGRREGRLGRLSRD